MKRAMFLFCGFCWLISGLAAGVFLWQYLAGGAGFQASSYGYPYFNSVSSGSVLIGLVHAAGFFILAMLCFLVGIGLCLHGFELKQRDTQE